MGSLLTRGGLGANRAAKPVDNAENLNPTPKQLERMIMVTHSQRKRCLRHGNWKVLGARPMRGIEQST